MLNHNKLLIEIQKFSDSIFFDHTEELKIAEKVWDKISNDSDFLQKIKQIQSPWALPSWQEEFKINSSYLINSVSDYKILATDGSQIYPDRHQGTSCFLINIGSAMFNYCEKSRVMLESTPFLFSCDIQKESTEKIDFKRQELEFNLAFNNILFNQNQNTENFLFLFDGSLIFWYLEAKPNTQEYLEKYLGSLYQFYKNNILIAGYISLPKNKELINLLRIECNENDDQINFDILVDTQIVNFYLQPGHRTIVFKHNSAITELYPTLLQPYFFYLNVGEEIARIEIPKWIAQDEQKISKITSIIMDQCLKGRGYPISLAEAHEQAVIKFQDSEFFYFLLHTLSIKNKKQLISSQKRNKKRSSTF